MTKKLPFNFKTKLVLITVLVLGFTNFLLADNPLSKIRKYVESSNHCITAYDIEANFNVLMTDPTFGAENAFNSALTSRVSVAALDATHFVVAYVDEANTNQGTAIIGLVSGITISSYGVETIFNAGTTTTLSVSALDATHFVVAYRDDGNSNRGTAIIGVTDGSTTISSYGSETVFNSTITQSIHTGALDATHFVISYRDSGGTNDGSAIVGLVSSGTTITFGAEVDHNTGFVTSQGVAVLDATHFVIAYRDSFAGTDGFAVVGVVSSGTTITFGTAVNFSGNNNAANVKVAALDATHFVVTYEDQSNLEKGTAIIGLTDGNTTISSFGGTNIFNTGITGRTSVAALSSTQFVVSYIDEGNSSQGTSIVGEVSGTTISSYGNEVVFNTGTTEEGSNSFISKLSSTHFVTGYEDVGNGQFGKAIVGTTSSVLPVVSNALDFDGTNDFVDLGTGILTGGSYTKEAWVNPRVAGCNNILSSLDQTQFWLASNKLTAGHVTTLGIVQEPVGNFPLDTWTHVAVTYDLATTTMKIYRNGVEVASSTTAIGYGDGALRIGVHGNGCFFDGKIDEVRIWNVARSAAEILANKDNELNCATAGLVACYHFNQGTAGGNNAGITTLTDGTANGNNGTLTNFALTGATSNWVAGATALPVELVSFDARLREETTFLTWQTATERNNEGFEIQRASGNAALEAGRWQVLAFVEGNGSTNEIQNYSYTDERPQSGLNYYRLKQIDFDGKFEFSDIVSVDLQNFQNLENLKIFPNPAPSDELTLYFPDPETSGLGEKATIRLYDQTGRLALQQITSSQQQTLNVSKLPAGIYFVEVTTGGKVFREKVVVE